MLVREMPVLAAARIIGITERLWRLVEHYVTKAVERWLGQLRDLRCSTGEGQVPMKLTRFRGHPNVGIFGVHDGKEAGTVCAGVPPADD